MKRPGGVTFAGWLIGINAFFLCVSGAILLFVVSSNETRLEDAGFSTGVAIAAGFVLLAIGLVLFLLIWALFGGSNGARWITTVLLVLGLLSNIRDVVGAERGGVTAWFSGLLAVIALVCLWGTPGAAEFFARPRPARQMPPPPPQTPLG
jgi:hypothetical protein